MENKVFAQNIEQIKTYNIELANKILMLDLEKSNIQLAQNENQEFNLIFNQIPLHSTINAQEEAKEICKKIENKNDKNALRIIYGLGLGYLADEFSNALEGKILIYEPNLDILKFVLSIARIDAIFKKNVILLNTLQDLENEISKSLNSESKISISFLNSYKNLFFDDIKKTFDSAQNLQKEYFGNRNTLIKSAPRAIRNSFCSITKIFKNPNISDLKDIYKNKTAVILSAGPSLRDNIELIKNNQDKFVIFALNPTIKMLQQHEIKPDFIVDIESSYTKEQFNTIDPKDYYFILEGFAHYSIHRFETKKTFNYLSNNNFLNPWIRDCLKLNDNLETFGTVSYTALMSAFIMGFKKIILIGQDLAYKNGLCYAKECHFGNLECVWDENENKYKIITNDFEKFAKSFIVNEKDKIRPAEIAKNRLKFLNDNLVTVKAQNGENIPTQTGYSVFIKQFEQAAIKLKELNCDIELINSSTGGAQINGFENIELKEILKTLEPIEKINLDNYSSNIDVEYILNKLKIMEKPLCEFISLSQDFNSINIKLKKEIEIKKTFTDNAISLLKKQRNILQGIIKLKTTQDFGYVVNIYLLKLEKYFNFNYLSDVNQAKETLASLIDECEIMIYQLNQMHMGLYNCKTLIIK